MTTILTYKPDKSVSFGDTFLLWGTDREETRRLLNDPYEVNDNIIDLSQYNNGDTSHNIIQRRDIYKNYKGEDNFFFLNFDRNDKLRDIEIHHGIDIDINGVVLNFSTDLEAAIQLLSSISSDNRKLSDGEYFFKDLKLTIANSDCMGKDGNNLAYFYCSNDISHLIKNEAS